MAGYNNKFATSATPHNSVRFYVDRGNERTIRFLSTVCIWGNWDHEINGYLGFEVIQEISDSVKNIMEALGGDFRPEILR
jgi:hypothetical protein